TTRVPTARSDAPGPMASTMPAASWPSSRGTGRGRLPSTTLRSEWQMPAASMRTSSSPGPGGSSLSSLTVIGCDAAKGGSAPTVSSTAPVMRMRPPCRLRSAYRPPGMFATPGMRDPWCATAMTPRSPAVRVVSSAVVRLVLGSKQLRQPDKFCRVPPAATSEGLHVDLYEYQARDLFESYGVPVLAGIVADTPEEVKAAAEKLGGVVVVKAQVKTGGRGKAGGVKVAKTPDEAYEAAQAILGLDIKGHVVKRVMVAAGARIAEEFYFSVLLDRANR